MEEELRWNLRLESFSKALKTFPEVLEEESPSLLFFDVLNYAAIDNPKLKKEIDNYGKVIYQIN